ncbi:DNA-binding protein [Aureimonas flava]|uniref:DNA-binding protein n=1 Tax=Aureimonas flava TaxID=2320271 RepID=A0A3A1WM68_9HYPH|nr:DNA-binding protein [Aureimonas flava]RIY01478.1 DNA-binding protein [Aureimonas flava]
MTKEGNQALDLIWGIGAIGEIIGRSERQTHYLVSIGEIPARKLGGRWVIERSKLIETFTGEAA